MITIYSLLEVIKYNIMRFKKEKILENIDIEKLEMDMYNSEEKMNGFSKAMFRELNECHDDKKVYCKK